MAQEFLTAASSPGEQIEENPTWMAVDDRIKTFKEESIGILFMPIPLNISNIEFTQGATTTTLENNNEKLFGTGLGVALNADFNASGFGFGTIAYYAIISGDQDLRANDAFIALKYDIPLGDRAETNFEISPLIGIGALSFQETVEDKTLGSSAYVSGGFRATWRFANNFFLGADVQTVPAVFNAEKLLGVEDQVDEAKINYEFIAQFNLSLRYSIF
ncbi:hypothetical protein GCM10008083_19400 [Ulvibacter litoralis]|nr:hypothetical protein GCM10008083_19400 [Ulvibacter litoralis]